MKNILTLIIAILSIASLSNSWGQNPQYCYTDTYDAENQYSYSPQPSESCGLFNHDFEDVTGFALTYYLDGITGLQWIFLPVSSTIDMGWLSDQVLLQANALGATQQTDVEFILRYEKDNCTMHWEYFTLVTPNAIEASIPDLCPVGQLDFNGFLTNGPTGGVWDITGITISNSGFANMGGVVQGTYLPTYTKNIPNTSCVLTREFPSFDVYGKETIGWASTPPSSMIDTDAPLDLSIYIQSSGGDVYFEGPGVLFDNGTWYFDPSAAGGPGAKEINIGTVSGDGCDFISNTTMQIDVLANPGVLSNVYIDLLYAGFDNILDVNPSFVFDYNFNNYQGGAPQNAPALLKIAQEGHSVCSEDTIKFKVGYMAPNYTYTWYSDISGAILPVGSGEYYTEFVPETSVNMKYKIYLSSTNNIGNEGPKDPFILQVNALPVSNEDTTVFCHDGDTTMYMPLSYDHPLSNFFYWGGTLDTTRLNEMTSYNWYNTNGNFLTRNVGYNYNWDGSIKYEEYKTVKTISSDVIIDDIRNTWHPYFVTYYPVAPQPFTTVGSSSNIGTIAINPLEMTTYGRDIYYRITKCDCDELSHSSFVASKQPELGYTSNVTGDIEIGGSVQYIDTTLFKGDGEVIWNFGDGSYDYTADTIWHYYNEYGGFNLTQYVTDQFGCYESGLYLSNITVTDYAGIDETGNVLEIYPNPTNGLLNIVGTDIKTISIENVSGQQVVFDSTDQIDISELETGLYILKIEFISGEVKIEKIVKK